jgi:hypothetical protein
MGDLATRRIIEWSDDLRHFSIRVATTV